MTTRSPAASLVLPQSIRPARKPGVLDKQAEFDHKIIKRRIEKAGFEVFRITILPNATGNQYWLLGGGVVNVYNTGTVVVGGKLTEKEKTRLKRRLCSRPI